MKANESNFRSAVAPQSPFLEERRQEILVLLQDQGRVSVFDLSRRFGVSEVTIRGDLQALAQERLIVRTHGGAVLASEGIGELALTMRRRRQASEKDRIGVAAAALVTDGDAIFLDSSSTSLAIAHHIKTRRHVTVITNGLEVAHALFDAPEIKLVLLGGMLDRVTSSFVGSYGGAEIQRFNIEKGFFGAHGIEPTAGLTDVSAEEAAVKRPIVNLCRQTIAVLDATKWGRVGLASFAELAQVRHIVTDHGAPAPLVECVRALGCSVTIV
jgi:DeoR/GlpR family transcriptional regulator of sugar metabolism